MSKIPQVITQDQLLLGLTRTGRECEACGVDMYDHEWVLMDEHGFVLYCNIVQKAIEIRNNDRERQHPFS